MTANHNTRYPRVEFRAGSLAGPLAARGDDDERNEIARRDLERLAGRLFSRVQFTDRCWEWLGSLTKQGYGQLHDPRTKRPALTHRLAWEICHAPIPLGLWVLHHCDNRPCVNPDHLFLGDVAANSRDMAAKGRQYLQRHPEAALRGEQHPRAKLTAMDVQHVRLLLARNTPKAAIGRAFGVSRSTIHLIAIGHNWRQGQEG